MNTKLYRILLALALLSLCSCAKEGLFPTKDPGKAITFSSFRQQVYTRADISEYNFIKDTKYTLLAVKSAASESAYAWESEMGFNEQPQAGQEGEDNKIVYTPVSTYPDNSSLDFFGLTYSSKETAPTLDDGWGDGVTPTVTLSDASGSLPDLMHCKDAKGKTPSDGVVLLPFEHALAAVNLLIACEDDKSTSTISVKNVKVTEIRLDNVAKSAKMNVASGEWTRIGEKGSRSVFTGEQALQVESNEQSLAQKYPIGPKDFLVFPNKNGGTVEEAVLTLSLTGIMDNGSLMNGTLSNGVVVTNGACTISVPIYDTSGSSTEEFPLEFKRNHKYTLSILVSHSKVRIVAVNPQVLEWVTVEPGTDHMGTLGQPITFGNTVWMDRNLGASSADCEGDWLHTLGYFYQFGRNIPFIVDVDAFVANNYKIKEGNGNVSFEGRTIASPVVDASGNIVGGYPDRNPAFPNYLVYTWDDKGNKVSLVSNQTVASLRTPGLTDGEVVAIDPGDTGTYAFISYYPNIVGPKYWYDENPAVFYNTHWSTPAGQPVPKGWRLPKKEDVYSIMPEKDFSWVPTNNEGPRFKGFGITDYPQRTSYSGTYQFFYGNIQVDPNASTTAPFSAPLRDENINITRVYGIKFQGTAKAYRYKIEMHTSNITDGKFVRFSLYPTGIDDIFLFNDDKSQWNLHQFDWEHESAHLDFPMQGNLVYSDPAMLELFGRDLKLTLSEAVPGSTNFYSLKLSNDGTGYVETYQATTCPTRLVRDL